MFDDAKAAGQFLVLASPGKFASAATQSLAALLVDCAYDHSSHRGCLPREKYRGWVIAGHWLRGNQDEQIAALGRASGRD